MVLDYLAQGLFDPDSGRNEVRGYQMDTTMDSGYVEFSSLMGLKIYT